MKTIVKYIRELSVVVVGIIITFGISFWVYSNNNRKDLNLHLNAIKLELEANADRFDNYAKWLQKSAKYANYLNSHDKKSLNKDTLNYYTRSGSDGAGSYNIIATTIVVTNAFEMFKISGAMRQMTDKELLMYVWEAYILMENAQRFIDLCFQIKRDEAMKEQQLRVEGKPVTIPMQVFYTTDLPQAMVSTCEEISKTLKEILVQLEEKL